MTPPFVGNLAFETGELGANGVDREVD